MRWNCVHLLLVTCWCCCLSVRSEVSPAPLFFNMSGSRGIYAIAPSMLITDENRIHVYGWKKFSLTLDLQGSDHAEGPLLDRIQNATGKTHFNSILTAGFYRAEVVFRLSEWFVVNRLPEFAEVTLVPEFEGGIGHYEHGYLEEEQDYEVTEDEFNQTGNVYGTLRHRFSVSLDTQYVILVLDRDSYQLGETAHVWVDILNPGNWAFAEPIDSNDKASKTRVSSVQLGEDETGGDLEELEPDADSGPNDVIFLQVFDDSHQLVYEWSEREVRQAEHHITFQLPTIGLPGQWSVRTVHPEEVVSFQVRASQNADPDVSFRTVSSRLGMTELSVCVRGTDYLPVAGRIKLAVCACYLSEIQRSVGSKVRRLPTHVSTVIMHSSACPMVQTGFTPRPCEYTYAELDAFGCTVTNITILLLTPTSGQQPPNTERVHLLCIRFYDPPTGVYHSVCKKNEDAFITRPPREDYEMTPKHYKPGLPSIFSIKLKQATNVGDKYVLTTISHPKGCPLVVEYYGLKPNQFTLYPRVDSNHEIVFTLPPLKHMGSLSTQAMRVNPGVPGEIVTRRGPHTYLTISDEVIQIWGTLEHIPVSACEGAGTSTATVTLVGNVPLADKHLYAYYNFGGRLIELQVENAPLAKEDSCENQDGPFGHYTCSGSAGEIECLPGWQGDSCLWAICKESCDPVGGECLEPGQCNCVNGFTGENCDICYECGPCVHGYECSCPWYSRDCAFPDSDYSMSWKETDTYNQTSFEKVSSRRTIFTRNVTLHLPAHLIGEFSVVLGYLARLPATDRLDFVFTSVTFLREPVCSESDTGPGVYFTASRGVVGSKLGVVVIPPQANVATLCHVRVWETTVSNTELAEKFVGAKLNALFFQRFGYRAMPPHHSDLALQRANLTAMLNREDMFNLDVPEDCTMVDYSMTESTDLFSVPPLNSLSPDSIFSVTSKVDQIGSFYGLNQTFDVVPVGASWKASAFCYGPNFGLWSATTEEPFELDPGYIFNITGATHVKVFEKVFLTANFWYDQTKMPFLDECYTITMKFMYNEDQVNILGPATYEECVCGLQRKNHYQLTVLLQPKMPISSSIISADVSLFSQACKQNMTVEEQPLDNSTVVVASVAEEELKEPLVYRLTMHALQVTETESVVMRHVSVILQQPGPAVSSKRISLTSLPTTSTGQPESNHTLWVEVMVNCLPITAVLNRVDRLFLDSPAWNVRHHLAVLSASNNVLNFAMLGIAGSRSDMQWMASKAIREAHKSADWITRFACPTNTTYGIILTPHIGQCDAEGDPWLLIDFFEVVCDMVSVAYPWRSELMDNYRLLFRAATHFEGLVNATNKGCLNMWNTTDNDNKTVFTEEQYAYTAKLYLILAENSFEDGYTQLKKLKESMQNITTSCLLELFDTTSIWEYSTVSLSYIARTLLKLQPEHDNAQLVLQEIETRRQVTRDPDTFVEHFFWLGGTGSALGEGDVRSTANAFMVYLAKPDTPDVSTVLLNTIRWLYQRQSWDGDFTSPEATIPALKAISGYSVRQSPWIDALLPHLPFKVSVHSPQVPDLTSSVELLGPHRATGSVKMIELMTERPLMELQIEMQTEQSMEMLSLKVTTFAKATVAPPQSGNIEIIIQSDIQVACPLASIRMCFSNKNSTVTSSSSYLSVTVIPQSGWVWTPEMYAKVTTTQYSLEEKDFIQKYLHIEQSGFLHMLVNHTDSMNCENLEFQWTGPMESHKPLTVQVVEHAPGDLVNTATYEMPSCRSDLMPVSGLVETVRIQRMPDTVLICPERISPLDEDMEVFIAELSELCGEQPVILLHLLPEKKGNIRVEVYKIWSLGLFDITAYRLHPSARQCPGLEDDQLMLVLPRAMVDIHPTDEYLNLNALNLVKLPISLLELTDFERKYALSILQWTSEKCDLYHTALRVALILYPDR